jgi:membrane protease YdiL (CAAX protease family)
MRKRRLLAILEVFSVTFILIPLLTLGLYWLFPAFESWQTHTVGFPFPVFVYVVMMVISLAAILGQGKSLGDYGLSFMPVKNHFDMAGTCFIPIVLANLPFGLGVDHTTWGGALILAVVQIVLLFVLARLLQKNPNPTTLTLMGLNFVVLPRLNQFTGPIPGKAIAVFLTYAFFVGFGEEILYRGYMQSRLNESFGKPYRFFGVAFGWGAILTALFFGLTHVGVLRWMLGMSTAVTWAWGFWTFFSGLVFGFVREKSGGILAPALLHGLPQAVAMVFMVFL